MDPLYCCTQQYRCNSPRVVGTNWVHTLGHFEPTKAPEERLELLVIFLLLCRTAAEPSTAAWLNPLSLGSKIDQPQEKVSHLGRKRLATSETPATGSTADASLLRKGSSDVLDRSCVLCPVDLVL